MNIGKRFTRISASAIMLFAVAGCSDNHSSNSDGTQVAAKVNGSEITVHQVNTELAMLTQQNANLDAAKETPAVLEKIINQELYIQQAAELELEKRPEVLQALEHARRKVMTQAYINHLVGALPEPTDTEIGRYYEENPALFKDRKIYQVQQIIFDPAADMELIRKKMGSVNTLDELSSWVKKENIRINARLINNAAEQLPLNLLPLIYKLKDGNGIFITEVSPPSLFWRMKSQDAPMTLEQATPYIKQYLANKVRAERLSQETEHLRQKAKIELKGSFAKGSASQSASQQKTVIDKDETTTIEKGLEGL